MATKKRKTTKKKTAKKKAPKKKKSVAKKKAPAKKPKKAAKKKAAKKTTASAKKPTRRGRGPESVFIVNPKSSGGKTEKRWPAIEKMLLHRFDSFEVRQTDGPGHATVIAREAIAAGAKNVIAIGGDGTISEVSAGFFDTRGKLLKKPGNASPALGIISAGSGSDFIKSVDIPRDIENAIDVIAKGHTRVIDMGLVTFLNRQGQHETRPFINIADVGIGGEVVDIVQSSGKRSGGLAYQIASLKGLLRYKKPNLKVAIDQNVRREGNFSGVIVCNGRYFGGGMKVAPHAELNDGQFDVIIMGELGVFETAIKMNKVRKGTHIYEDKIEVARARRVTVEAEGKSLLDLDGENPGQCPVKFQIVPNAIKVLIP